MSPRDNSAPLRRHPSLSSRSNTRTAVHPAHLTKVYTLDNWRETSPAEACLDDAASAVEDVEQFSGAVPRRRTAKSFSGLRHPMEGLVALGRRLSVTLRNKSSKHNLHLYGEEKEDDCRNHCVHSNNKRHTPSGSLSTKKSAWYHGHSINRRPSLHSVSALHSFYAPTASVLAPIPGCGLKSPILPNDKLSGAAARAAAAAENEKIEQSKLELKLNRLDLTRMERDKTSPNGLTKDSESGIGIYLRDRSDLSEIELDVVRCDPALYLPSEIMAFTLSLLDPVSLMNAESVSRSWNHEASSRHVWKHVFRSAYPRRSVSATETKNRQSAGLGKNIPNQDWKKMFLVRRALDLRWKEGKAAAIYLYGHKDSVYCAQFDENKIITGSRDRTIRIWDAHYPWSCLKVIGPPTDDSADVQMTNPTPQATGVSPFLTITPPSVPLGDIITPMEYHSASILCLKFDEEIMVTGSSDFSCIVWDIKDNYRPILRLKGHSLGVLDVCFDDRFIISCSKDSTICVWDRKTGELLERLTGHRGPVNAVQLRGDLIVSASGDGVVKLWNVISGTCVKEFPSKDRGLACVEFSDDGRTILTGGNDRAIYKFDANTGEMVNALRGHSHLVRSLHLDTMNKRIVSGSYDMSVKVFDSESGELSLDLAGWTTSWILNVQSDYRRIVATSQDSRAVIVDFGYGLDGVDLLEE
ncbi:hypothetical protein N7495_007890 [Penicillium taxi]|uniref:uncharacterized protein n=1 Tax=Penicillium taxi TaxID=168475 RepID=UPI00254575D9|nr:uncharacterized protein N7495_007890 [Penicillium taxi]KAJ5887849.1 hypothetical protein N7495_007890 [Penicillium taxi]